MSRFHLLEHTADIGIEALAEERKGLAEQSGLGLRFLLFSDAVAEPTESAEVSAGGNSGEEALVNWLNELLFLMTEGGLVPAQIDIVDFSEKGVTARVSGEPYDPRRHQMLREIKAVTHHQVSISHAASSWKSVVYLDL